MLLLVLNLICSFLLALVIHEVGHLIAAKLCKVPIREAGLGWGTKIFSRQFADIEYTVRALPVGAYVRMDMPVFRQRLLHQQLFVLLAGIFLNLVCAILFAHTFFGNFNLALAIGNLFPIYQQDGWKCGLLICRRMFGRSVPLVEWTFTIAGGLLALLLVLLALTF